MQGSRHPRRRDMVAPLPKTKNQQKSDFVVDRFPPRKSNMVPNVYVDPLTLAVPQERGLEFHPTTGHPKGGRLPPPPLSRPAPSPIWDNFPLTPLGDQENSSGTFGAN